MRQVLLLLLTSILAVGLALAQETPKRKSGLWEMTGASTRSNDKPSVGQVCIDQATDNALRRVALGIRVETCKTEKLTRDGDKLIVDATCKLRHRYVSKTHAVITGTFDSAYKIESKSTFDPPFGDMSEGHAVIEAKWTGPCKPDQHPGDMILPSGLMMHVDDDALAAQDWSDAKPKRNAPAKVRKPGSATAPTN